MTDYVYYLELPEFENKRIKRVYFDNAERDCALVIEFYYGEPLVICVNSDLIPKRYLKNNKWIKEGNGFEPADIDWNKYISKG